MNLWKRFVATHQGQRRRGQAIVLFALGFTALAGGLGMGADMGLWLVERQRLQTAVDSASIAGARYWVAYYSAADQDTQARTQATSYLANYGYSSSNLTCPSSAEAPSKPSGLSGSPCMGGVTGTTAQFGIAAKRARDTMLLRLIGINTLDAVAVSVADAEIKADIYAMIDVTQSMSSTEIGYTQTAVTQFINFLNLSASNPEGPKVAIGRFGGERCRRTSGATGSTFNTPPFSGAEGDLSVSTQWGYPGNWVATTGDWCDNNDSAPNPGAGGFGSPTFNTATAPPCKGAVAATSSGCSSSASGTCLPSAPVKNPFYPNSQTTCMLGQSSSAALGAVSAITTGLDYTCATFGTTAAPSLAPYYGDSTHNCENLTATSHTAGLATAYHELLSNRTRYSQGQTQYRRVLTLQTDGTTCSLSTPYSLISTASSQVGTYVTGATLPQHGNSKATRGENRSMALANAMKNNPNSFQGIEIFTIMAWDSAGGNTCPDKTVLDTEATYLPDCPDAGSLGSAGSRRHVDDYMIAMSSSSTGTCDHYLPIDNTDPNNLPNAYRKILARLAVGRLVS